MATRTLLVMDAIEKSDLTSRLGRQRDRQVMKKIRDHWRETLDSTAQHTNWLVGDLMEWDGPTANVLGMGFIVRHMSSGTPTGKEWFISYAFRPNSATLAVSECFQNTTEASKFYMVTSGTNTVPTISNGQAFFHMHYDGGAPTASAGASTGYNFEFDEWDHAAYTTTMTVVDPPSSAFAAGEIITGATSGVKAIFLVDNTGSYDICYIVPSSTNETFVNGETLTGSISGSATAGTPVHVVPGEGHYLGIDGDMDVLDSTLTGSFTVGETVRGNSSRATATVLAYAANDLDVTDIKFGLNEFTAGEIIEGLSSGAKIQAATTINLTGTYDYFNPTNDPRTNLVNFMPDDAQAEQPYGIIFDQCPLSYPTEQYFVIDHDTPFIAEFHTDARLPQMREASILGEIINPIVAGDTYESGSLFVRLTTLDPTQEFWGWSAVYGYFSGGGSKDFFTPEWPIIYSRFGYRRFKRSTIDVTGATPAGIDGDYFLLYDLDGSVAFWFDVDNNGTSEPAHGADRSVEVTTVVSADDDIAISLALATAIDNDMKFKAVLNDNDTIIAVQAEATGLSVAADGTTGFSFSSVGDDLASWGRVMIANSNEVKGHLKDNVMRVMGPNWTTAPYFQEDHFLETFNTNSDTTEVFVKYHDALCFPHVQNKAVGMFLASEKPGKGMVADQEFDK